MKNLLYLSILLIFVSCTQSAKQSEGPFSKPGEFKLLSYNVFEGFLNNDTIKNMYVDWVKKINPDMVAYQEMNHFTQKSLEELAARYGHPYAIQSKEEGYPVALTSKYPIVNVQKVIDNMHHVYLYANVNGINVMVVHFSPRSLEKRRNEVREILARAALIPQNEKILVMGDFNSLAEIDAPQYSDEMLQARIETEAKDSRIRNLDNKKFDYSITNAMLDAGYIDLLKVFHKEFLYTFSTEKYRSEHISRIDYVWANDAMAKYIISADVVYDGMTEEMSDHLPLLVTFDLK